MVPSSKISAGDGTQPSRCDHFVQFYDTEDQLLQSLRSYVSIGLRRGETVLSIASAEHGRQLEALLEQEGDVHGARRHGRYIPIVAEELLPQFLQDGFPCRGHLVELVDSLLARPAREGRPIRAFGEMVALLWREGRQEAALKLEEFWDELVPRYRLSLFCAYPTEFFKGRDRSEYLRVCRRHGRILPADPAEARTLLAEG